MDNNNSSSAVTAATMANHHHTTHSNNSMVSSVSPSSLYHHQHHNTNAMVHHHCNDCGLTLNSAESLEVHRHYHKDNLLNKWAATAAATTAANSPNGEENNNAASGTTIVAKSIKREFVPANNLDAKKSSPDHLYNHHPPTPQSYHSASSPYHNTQNTTTPTNNESSTSSFIHYSHIKSEPLNHSPPIANSYPNFNSFHPATDYYNYDPQQYHQHSAPDFSTATILPKSYRYQPYHTAIPPSQSQHPPPTTIAYDHHRQPPSIQQVVSSSSPVYPPQPTPSPSPKQCDKCGCVCESAAQLIDHINISHPATLAFPSTGQFNNSHLFRSDSVATDQSDILDLDSHKVHQIFAAEEKHTPTPPPPPSVNALLTWSQQHPIQQQQQQHKNALSAAAAGMFLGNTPPQQHFSSPPLHDSGSGHFHQLTGGNLSLYDQRQQLQVAPPSQANSISSTQQQSPHNHNASSATALCQQSTPLSPPAKAANWKSNEARRPKTYKCASCNKWFTSSGHLKRHYNTTLHKNAVKASGLPDPALSPISLHHHPNRDARSSGGGADLLGAGDAQQQHLEMPPPDDGPHGPDIMPPPPLPPPSTNATPSASSSASATSPLILDPGSSASSSPLTSPHFASLYPNGSAPHVMPIMLDTTTASIISCPNIITTTSSSNSNRRNITTTTISISNNSNNFIGDFETTMPPAPLPSFASHFPKMGLLCIDFDGSGQTASVAANAAAAAANVGGAGPVTGPHPLRQSFLQHNLIDHVYNIVGNNQHHLQFGAGGIGGYVNAFIRQPCTTSSSPLTMSSAIDEASRLTGTLTVADAAPLADDISMYEATISNMMLNGNLAGLESPTGSSADNSASLTFRNDMEEAMQNKRGTSPLVTSSQDPNLSNNQVQGVGSTKTTSAKSSSGAAKRSAARSNNHNNQTAINNSSVSTSSTASVPQVYTCAQCDNKMFNRACYLTQHIKTRHSGAKPYKCDKCGKRFPSKPTCQEHARRHMGEKPHKCLVRGCDKTFNHKTDLTRHMCKHTGQKPYSCDTCGKGFIRKDHMKKHCEIHTKKPGSRGQGGGRGAVPPPAAAAAATEITSSGTTVIASTNTSFISSSKLIEEDDDQFRFNTVAH